MTTTPKGGLKVEVGPAEFSPDPQRTYRYTLHRFLPETSPDQGLVNFLMLNPSTADENALDNTLRRCAGYTKAWGFHGFVITNLFAVRTRHPSIMKLFEDPVGPDNDAHILQQAQQSETVVCGWGVDGKHRGRDLVVKTMLKKNGIDTFYLKLTQDGHPNHPLFLSSELHPVRWYY